jgi:hypothetical protein
VGEEHNSLAFGVFLHIYVLLALLPHKQIQQLAVGGRYAGHPVIDAGDLVLGVHAPAGDEHERCKEQDNEAEPSMRRTHVTPPCD